MLLGVGHLCFEDQHWREFAQVWPEFGLLDLAWPGIGQSRTEFGRCLPEIGSIARKRLGIDQSSADFCSKFDKFSLGSFDRDWPGSTKIGPNSVRFAQALAKANFDQHWDEHDHIWPGFGRIWPEFDRVGAAQGGGATIFLGLLFSSVV